jgi:hypothetical protein
MINGNNQVTSVCSHSTSDVIFDSDETEFLVAMDRFKRATGKRFPTLTETMGVFKSLGYEKKRVENFVGFEAACA